MGCRRAFDVDLVACLLDRDRPEWETFRDHYPTCADCATEVRTWTELQAELAPAHPEPARLVRYQDEPASLRADERHAIRDHVAGCTGCRDELHMLRTTDLAALVRAGTAVVTPARSRAPRRVRAPRRRLGARLRSVLWQPGLAYAVALLLLIPALAPYRDRLVPPRVSVDELRRDVRQRADLHDAAQPAAAPAAARVAEEAAPARALQADRAPNVLGQAAAPLATEAAAEWPRLDMTPTSSHLVIADSPGLVLTLPAPGDAVTAGPAELRIRDGSRRRELRERYFGPPTDRFAMRVPAEWLESGHYVVELYVGDDTPAATATLDVAVRGRR